MLRLINLDDDARALLYDLPSFERQYGASTGEYAALIQEIADQTGRLLDHDIWGGYLAVDTSASLIVGTCAFKSRPSPDGEVEIAYFTFEQFEGRGIATRMALALIDVARSAPEVSRIIAYTLPQPGPSPRILEKVGMTFDGEVVDPVDGVVWRWSLTTDHASLRGN